MNFAELRKRVKCNCVKVKREQDEKNENVDKLYLSVIVVDMSLKCTRLLFIRDSYKL